MRNYLLIAPLSLCLTFLLFFLLSNFTRMELGQVDTSNKAINLDFSLERKELDMTLKDRKRPEPPEEIVSSDMPAMPESQALNNNASQVFSSSLTLNEYEPSNIEMDIRIDLGSALKNIGAPKTTSEMFAMDLAFDANPTVLKRSSPRYPSKALRRKLEGYVTVEFKVNDQGEVVEESLLIVDSKPKNIFDSSVLRSIKRWRFAVQKVNGKAAAYRTRQTVEFKLDS